MQYLDMLRKETNPLVVLNDMQPIEMLELAKEMGITNPKEKFEGSVLKMKGWIEENLPRFLTTTEVPWPQEEAAWPTDVPMDTPPLPEDVPAKEKDEEPRISSAWNEVAERFVANLGIWGALLKLLMVRVSPKELARSAQWSLTAFAVMTGKSILDPILPTESTRLTMAEFKDSARKATLFFAAQIVWAALSADGESTAEVKKESLF